jgi:PIN domain nuclease of toxin-antitoxin system
MRFLLDTHALAWAIGQPKLLSKKVLTLLEKPESEIIVSPVSVWEMSIKHKAGKWPEVAPFMDEQLYETFLEKLGATELEITSRHTRLAGQFDTSHKDPFDRLLAAQAVTEGITLISKDEVMQSFPVVRIW